MNGRGALSLLKWAEGELARSGIECAKRDAEELLIHSCRIRREDIFLNNPEPRNYDTNLFKHYVKQRAFRRPLQYILKSAEFMGNPLTLEEGVFIPRPETELLVEKVLERVKTTKQKNILEIGTGSGNIAISLTKNTTHCKIITCDISEKALEIASKNAGINGVSGQIKFLRSNLFDEIPRIYYEYFDIIISNPPYVKRAEIEYLQPEIAYEDTEAFDGGEDGFHFYNRILGEGTKYLKDKGIFAFEIGHSQAEGVMGIIAKDAGFLNTVSFKDYNGLDRVILTEFRRTKHG